MSLRRARLVGTLAVLASLMLFVAVFAQAGGNGSKSSSSKSGASQAPEAKSYYTAVQATIGSGLYNKYCQLCHGANLQGLKGPPLKGQAFAKSWEGGNLTVDDLFYEMSTQMPDNGPGPGGLSRQQYVDLVAYLLQQNGYPAGKTPLPSKDSAMQKLKLTAQPSSSASG